MWPFTLRRRNPRPKSLSWTLYLLPGFHVPFTSQLRGPALTLKIAATFSFPLPLHNTALQETGSTNSPTTSGFIHEGPYLPHLGVTGTNSEQGNSSFQDISSQTFLLFLLSLYFCILKAFEGIRNCEKQFLIVFNGNFVYGFTHFSIWYPPCLDSLVKIPKLTLHLTSLSLP